MVNKDGSRPWWSDQPEKTGYRGDWQGRVSDIRTHLTASDANPKDAIGRTKDSLRLLSPTFLRQTAQVMRDGAEKYGEWNFRDAPVNLTVYIEAAMRHLLEMLDGKDVPDDSHHHCAAHVAANMNIILDALAHSSLIDDRWTPKTEATHGDTE